jgi:SagB-type dehydrogenase family enzyme
MTTILDYHEQTSHSRGRVTGRPPNQENRPMPFKRYAGVPTLTAGAGTDLPDVPLDQAMLGAAGTALSDRADLPGLLASTCSLAAGISQARKLASGAVFHFRTVPSAGALFPAELYLAVQNVSGMDDGVYHYCPILHSMSQLRAGPVFVPAGSERTPMARFLLTAVFFRSAWKYGARAYRYCLLDAGHMAQNLLLATAIHGLGGSLDYDFDDAALNAMLGLDPTLEGCLAVVHTLGCDQTTAWAPPPRATVDDLPGFSRCAAKPESPPELLDAHRATASFARCPSGRQPEPPGEFVPLPDPEFPASTAATLLARRSRRDFVSRPTPARDLTDLLGLLCLDQGPDCTGAVHAGFLADHNSGLTPGRHALLRAHRATTLLASGSFITKSARVCLDQGWLDTATIHLTFTADLAGLVRRCGPRAYRYAQLEAGRLGQLAYLAATAKRLGACGIGAFFDREAATLLALPEGHELLYLVAVGCVRTP